MHAAIESCKHEKNEMPRPLAFEACETGYKGGAEMAETFAAQVQKDHELAEMAAAEMEKLGKKEMEAPARGRNLGDL